MIENNDFKQLSHGASAEQLELATAFNHTELFCLSAHAAGGEVHHTDGVTWTHAGEAFESMIAFPVLKNENAANVLDRIIQYYLGHPPKGAGCWSLDPAHPPDLGVMLLARGFQPGWHPNWQVLNLDELKMDHPVPAGLQVVPDNFTPLEKIDKLPYGETDLKIFSGQKSKESVLQRFIATLNNNVVAHCSVLLTNGALGTAGIYHVGVLPGARKRGIGKAVVGAACKYAKDHGYNYALLNGTGFKMYEQLGFRKLGTGNTWWLVTSRLLAHPPSKNEIELAEAIGRGDTTALSIIRSNQPDHDLSASLTNGMTLMQLAVHCRQAVSADWLISRGLSINVMEAWDLGWIDRATLILAENPTQANMQFGEWGLTMLHIAVDRNDLKLARLALSANPDTSLNDTLYKSTALEWARHLHNEEMVKLIESHLTAKAKE